MLSDIIEDLEDQRSRDKMETLCRENTEMLNEFAQFLIKKVDPEKGQEYANNIQEFVDVNDFPGSYKRVKNYIDSVMQQHTAN
jgi:hypothetical protein